MRKPLALLAGALLFTGCAVPSVNTVVRTDKGGQTTKPLVKLPANTKGDLVVTRTGWTLTTPRNADGSIAMERIPVLNKDKTAVLDYRESPVLAEMNTGGPIESWGRAIATSLRALGSVIGKTLAGMVGLGAANETGQVAGAVTGR